MKFENKVALVTGSSRGIGRATALALAREGAKVAVNYVESKAAAEKVVQEIKTRGSEAIAIKADVSSEKDVAEMFKKIEQTFGRLDILVNNAGVVLNRGKKFSELTIADWEGTLRVNLIGTFLCAQAAIPLMLKNKYGRIVNISSIRGLEHCGTPNGYAYAASKAGVINFTKILAKEFSPIIAVNCIAPGWVETDISGKLTPDFRKKENEKIYLNRFAKPKEIANAVLFLASDDASYITGQVLIVDGGYSLK